MYEIARAYYIDHGDLDVPSNYVTPEGERLGPWINRQRRVRDGKVSGTLDADRIHRLDAIGMSWLDLAEERWNRNFRALRAYYERYGDLDVPQTYVTSDGLHLGQFVKNMRFHKDTKYPAFCLTKRYADAAAKTKELYGSDGVDAKLARAAAEGIVLRGLSSYCAAVPPRPSTLVMGYGGLRDEQIPDAAERLKRAWS